VKLIHAMLSGVFRRAVKRGDLATNPCARADVPAAQAPETPTWSLNETQRFFASDVVRADPLYSMLRIVAASGLRRGEALGLGWSDVDLDAGIIHVVHNAVMVDGRGRHRSAEDGAVETPREARRRLGPAAPRPPRTSA
jgi:integrase